MSVVSSLLGTNKKGMLILQKQSKGAATAELTVAQKAKIIAQRTAVTNLMKTGMNQSNLSLASQMLGSNYHIFEFQYNPEVLRFNSRAGIQRSRQGAPEGGLNNITNVKVSPEVSLHFSMFFTDINTKDAFAEDKLIVTSATAIINSVAAVVSTYSVADKVEGLVSVVTQYSTRQAIFALGPIVFTGEIESVNAEYMMFSPSGHPIMARVDLSIKESSIIKDAEGNEQPINPNSYWDDAYRKYFGKHDEDLELNTRGIDSSAGSLLNFNL